MDKINYNMLQFHDQLMDLINNCQLPIGTAYYVCKDVFGELERAFQQCVKAEAEAPATEPIEYEIKSDDILAQNEGE